MAYVIPLFALFIGLLSFPACRPRRLGVPPRPCSEAQSMCDLSCGKVLSLAPCQCDRVCMLYQDCCEGFNASCPDVHQEALLLSAKYPDVRPLCQPDGSGKVLEGCKPREGKEPLAANCSQGSSLEDPNRFPVYVPDSGLSFVNSYCALCNDFSSKDWQVWNSGIPYPKLNEDLDINSPQTVEELLANALNQTSPRSAEIKLVWSHPETQPRLCPREAVGQCPDLGTGGELEAACSGYASYVKDKSGLIFLNRHCALCHGESQCFSPDPRDFQNSGRSNMFSALMRWRNLDSDQSVLLEKSSNGIDWSTMTCSLKPVLQCNINSCPIEKVLLNGQCEAGNSVTVSLCWVGSSRATEVRADPDSFPQTTFFTSVSPQPTGRPTSTAVKSRDFPTRRRRREVSTKGCSKDYPETVVDLAKFLLHETGRFLAALSPGSQFANASVQVEHDKYLYLLVRGRVWPMNATDLLSVVKASRTSDHFKALLSACLGRGSPLESVSEVCLRTVSPMAHKAVKNCFDLTSLLTVQPEKSGLVGGSRALQAKCRAAFPSIQVLPDSGKSGARSKPSGSGVHNFPTGSGVHNLPTGSDVRGTPNGSEATWPGMRTHLPWWLPLLVCWRILQFLGGPLSLQV